MNKTIEEAAKEFADLKTIKQAGSSVERDKKALLMTQFFHFALEELPLSERLTAEEKERIRTYHKLAHDGYWKCNCADKAVVKLLESIFGSDFFKEEV